MAQHPIGECLLRRGGDYCGGRNAELPENFAAIRE